MFEFEDDLEERPLPPLCAKLNCGALQFNLNSAVIKPAGLQVVAAALAHAREHPDRKLLVLSHTDQSGSATDNEKLSQQRARSVLCLLLGAGANQPANRDAWVDNVKERNAGLTDVHELLAWAKGNGVHCDPGPKAPATFTPAFGEEVAKFKKGAHGILEIAGDPDPATADFDPQVWRLAFELFLRALQRELAVSPSDYAKLCEGLAWAAEARSIGCGQKHPLENTGGVSQKNRRTEFFFFPPESEPPAAGALAKLYDKKSFRFEELPCPEKDVEITLTTPAEADVVVVFDVSGSMGATDNDSQGRSRWVRLKPAVLALIDQLGESHASGTPRHVNAIAFGADRNVHRMQVVAWKPAQPYGSGGRKLPLVDATAANVAALKTWVEGFRPAESTPAKEALELAFCAVGAGNKVPPKLAVVFVSDGLPNQVAANDPGAVNALVSQISSWRRGAARPEGAAQGNRLGWRIDTYGFAFGTGGFRFMAGLARNNGGQFVPI